VGSSNITLGDFATDFDGQFAGTGTTFDGDLDATIGDFTVRFFESVVEDYADMPGNIENFGAVRNDITAAAANTVAINAALASNYTVFIPGGDFYHDATLFITKPKIVYCLGKEGAYTRLNYSRKDAPTRWERFDGPHPGEASRLIATNILKPAVHIQSDQVHFYGGAIDVASDYNYPGESWSGTFNPATTDNDIDIGGLVDNDSICVIVDAQTGFTGGGLYNVSLMGGGRQSVLYTNSSTTTMPRGLIFRYNGRPSDARIINFHVEITSGSCWNTYESDVKTGTQKCSNNFIKTWVQSAPRTMYEQAGTNNVFFGHHQSAACLSLADRDIVASHYFSSPGNIIHMGPQVDFNGNGPSVVGHYNNAKGNQLEASTVIEPRIGSAPYVKAILGPNGEFRTGVINETHIHEFPDNSNASWAPAGTDLDISGDDVGDANNVVNLHNKQQGTEVFITGSGAPGRVSVIASGPNPTDPWYFIDGTLFDTPS